MLLEGDPFSLLEGMTIAAYAVGASEGYVYVRSEYPDAIATLRRAIDVARAGGWLGRHIAGREGFTSTGRAGRRRRLHLRRGDLDARQPRGQSAARCAPSPRSPHSSRPLRPATVVNNVLTLAAVPMILADGGEAYAALGVGRSRGTQVFQLAGNVKQGGIVEADFGVTLVS
jgi:formate dehydrogenase iron-sulfur subunit